MRLLFFFLILHISAVSVAQTADWLMHYPGSNSATGFRVIQGEDEFLYGVGKYGSWINLDDTLHSLSDDLVIAKWDTSGNVLWSRSLDNTASWCGPWAPSEDYRATFFHEPGDILIIASTRHCYVPNPTDPTHTTDLILSAFSNGGDHLWTTMAFAGTGNSVNPGPILYESDSTFAINASATAATSFWNSSIQVPPGNFIVSYNLNGDLLSVRTMAENGAFSLTAYSDTSQLIAINGDPSTTLFGQPAGFESSGEGFIATVDTASDAIHWTRFFRSTGFCHVWAAAHNGMIAAMAFYSGTLLAPIDTIADAGQYGYLLAILDQDGNVTSVVPITSPEAGTILNLRMSSDGLIYIYGTFWNSIHLGTREFIGGTSNNGIIAKFNTSGDLISTWHFGKIKYGNSPSILPLGDALYVSATIDSTLTIADETLDWDSSSNVRALFLAKFDELIGFTAVPEYRNSTTGNLHIYANPNNGTCTIELPDGLEWTSGLALSIYDTEGRTVQIVPLRRDDTNVALDIRAQAKGIYPVELTDGLQRFTGTIVFE
ncbi:MAG: T9SS type A sorting domain-containing protein [Bacteroidota bacterium]|nr:T9SS type A sorting domain-containing protein [Bacteroidota bacterium]